MKKNVLKLLVFLITTSTFAQSIGSSNVGSRGRFFSDLINKEGKSVDYTGVDGSPYIVKEFFQGKINEYPNEVLFRYNAYRDVVEIKANSKTYELPRKEGNKVYNSSLKLAYTVLKNPKTETIGYYKEELVLDNFTLLSKQKVKFLKAKQAVSSYDIAKPARFKRLKDVYYLRYKDGKFKELPKKKKAFFKLMGDKKDQVKKFAKENGLKHKRKEDLFRILRYYSSL
ncbi:hypothetical protein [Tenacibaculum jejuense]|uniref:Uncharacterized protein n=1 Tax=Tenacibaculum jejuense TaxID=584609 RepID=A0A238UEU2_9FLAO|nr:hypothetical protein [Tenacibaculum jejuense]SNR17516.1 exported protein of unknown function [Tenacibaculum jejuense]